MRFVQAWVVQNLKQNNRIKSGVQLKLIKVSDETHRLLKIAAAYEQRSITAIADVAVTEYINRVKREAGARNVAASAADPAEQAQAAAKSG